MNIIIFELHATVHCVSGVSTLVPTLSPLTVSHSAYCTVYR